MNFEITPDNEPYLNGRGKIVLNACPGSGKTSSVAYKLTILTKECEKSFGAYSGIACISFTNVAKDEINEKFKSITGTNLVFPNVVSTIDSFINQYITLPFYHLLDLLSKRPLVLDTVAFLDEMDFGWFATQKKQHLKYSYAPSKIKIEIDGTYTWKGSRPNPTIVDPTVFEKYAKSVKDWQFRHGYINNDDSTYIAYHLLKTYPSIGKSLVKRFPYIVVDEAQDTSEVQYKIFDLLVSYGLENIEFVGDPYQSLYEFREARPDLFLKRFRDTDNWNTFRLNNCRRSSQNVINAYSILRGGDQTKIISTCKHVTDHKVKVLRYDEKDLGELLGKYNALIDPALTNQILVRGNTLLEQFGVKPLDENPWKNNLAKTLIKAELDMASGHTKACIDGIRMFLSEITIPKESLANKRSHAKELKTDLTMNVKLFDFARNMPSIDDSIISWSQKMANYIREQFGVEVDLELKQKKGQPYYQQNLKTLMSPKVTTAYPISTIHKVKGMTFNSVLVVLSANSSGQNISLSDFVQRNVMPNEKQRMLYVALSRPEALSCIAIPKTISEEQIREQLGENIEFV